MMDECLLMPVAYNPTGIGIKQTRSQVVTLRPGKKSKFRLCLSLDLSNRSPIAHEGFHPRWIPSLSVDPKHWLCT